MAVTIALAVVSVRGWERGMRALSTPRQPHVCYEGRGFGVSLVSGQISYDRCHLPANGYEEVRSKQASVSRSSSSPPWRHLISRRSAFFWADQMVSISI